MDAKELKQYIISNNLLETLLEKIGCHSFVPYNNEMRCALPDDRDNSKVSIFSNEDITVRIFTKGKTIYGSIYDLIMFIDNCNFIEALRKCQNVLGISATHIIKNKTVDHLSFYKAIKKNKKSKNVLNTYGIELLEKFNPVPHIDLIKKDCIFQDVIDRYLIMFDEKTDRIVFPHFKYDDNTKIVGLIGRTVNPAYESLNIPKYHPIDGYKYEKSKNLYGLSHNIDDIKRDGLIIVYESEKSVLKSTMFKMPYGVSVGCHELSDFQKQLLISLNVEIVIAFDKDVQKDHIHNIVNELNKYRKVSFIEDSWNLLKAKDSPVDRGYKRFQYLLKHRHYL